jgi:hypothetical protein
MSYTIDTEIFELFKDDSKNNIKRRRINSLQDINSSPFKVELFQEEKYSPASSRERLVRSNSSSRERLVRSNSSSRERLVRSNSSSHIQNEYKNKLKKHPNEDIRHLFSIHFENDDKIVEPKNISFKIKKDIFESRSEELKTLLTNRLKNFINSSLEKQKKFIPENIIEEHIYKRTFKELNRELLNSSSIPST